MSSKNYVEIETAYEVYCAIVRAHQVRLRVFSSYTGDNEADTVWGFDESETPVLHANTRWDDYDEETHQRRNVQRRFWLCLPKESHAPTEEEASAISGLCCCEWIGGNEVDDQKVAKKYLRRIGAIDSDD